MNTSMNKQFQDMNFEESTKKSINQLEIDNAYLLQQNKHLTKELSFTRYTIHALKNINQQRDNEIKETRQELERALQHIQLLSCTIRQRYSLAGIGPQLMQDDDDLSEEDELFEETRHHLDIMSKLPIRHPSSNQIFIKEY